MTLWLFAMLNLSGKMLMLAKGQVMKEVHVKAYSLGAA